MSDKSEIVFIPNGREKIRCTAEGKTFFYTDEMEARMSVDLVKRLRDLGDHASFEPHMHHTAADRIEELEAELSKQIEWVKSLADDLIAAEGREARLKEKLAKAVEVAEKSIKWLRLYGAGVHREAVALKKLTGGKDE